MHVASRIYSVVVTIMFYLAFTVVNYFCLHVFNTWGILSTHSMSYTANIALTVIIIASIFYFRDRFFTWASLFVVGRLLDSATTYYALQFPFFYESNLFIAGILDKPQYVFLLNMAVGVPGGIYVAAFMTQRPDPRDKAKYLVSLVRKATSLNVLLASWLPVINNLLAITYSFLAMWL
jgi:hypothetical protein